MNFLEIAKVRQSCRSYNPDHPVEAEKLQAVLEAVRLAPSACNSQPYHLTVCRGKPPGRWRGLSPAWESTALPRMCRC